MSETTPPVVLEPAARAFAEATASPPYLFDLGPAEGRKMVDQMQAGDIARPEVEIEDTTVPGGPAGQVSVRILRPKGAGEPLPVILYIHGAGSMQECRTYGSVRGAPSNGRPYRDSVPF